MSAADATSVTSPLLPGFSSLSSKSHSSVKLPDDTLSLTSFNPFSEDDENDKSSYAIVTSLISRMKNTLSAPLSSSAPATVPPPANASASPAAPSLADQRRSSHAGQSLPSTSNFKTPALERPNPLLPPVASAAPPLVSLTPAQSEVSFNVEYDRSPSRAGAWDAMDGGIFGTSIPGFPIPDDARSIRTSASLHRSGSVSKVIRRLRGEGLSRHYWMDDENCKECYDCKSVFTTWRRKHHCRICGQIFCSRCASNIIKGSRFGHEGMVRVCNLCLEKLGRVDEDDDDRRSIVSSVNSFPAHQFGSESFGSLAFYPQSPYFASQMFDRKEDSFNLYSITETKRPFFRSGVSPEHFDGMYEDGRESPAPFRRAISEEEKYSSHVYNQDDIPVVPGRSTPIHFPRSTGDANPSSVQFPIGSPDHLQESPRHHDRLRSGFNSYVDSEVPTPFIRSRVHSRLDNIASLDIGWRTRRESTAYAQELNLTSMHHLKIMLRQMLAHEQIPNIKEWEETLSKLALRIARDMTFTVLPHRQGEDMDIRRYVKIKKIPGGAPHDSEYVDGAVITKNVAHKRMSRQQNHPRIMLVTFPLEFHRVEGQYMHFGQIVRQEKEYLTNLVARIAALRPHIVMVERSVSRLALDSLAEQSIAVARSVKTSAITTIARMTQADVFSSMDKLALEPRLGHCGRYRLQTFDHPLIPNRRKTYMRFEGCHPDMGCTIILRGTDIITLRRLKKVMRFVTFMVRNLKLETHLWKDSLITLPSFINNPDAVPTSYNLGQQDGRSSDSLLVQPFDNAVPDRSPLSFSEELLDEDAEQRRLSRCIAKSLEPYIKTFISVSATLRFSPPYVLRRMWELDLELREAKRAWEDEVVRREERLQADRTNGSTTAEASSAQPKSLQSIDGALPSLAFEAFLSPSLMSGNDSQLSLSKEDDASNLNDFLISSSPPLATPSIALSTITTPPTNELPLRTAESIRLESRLSLLKWQHEEHRRIWEWYLRKNKDDFVVETYQRITLWEYTIPISQFAERRACFAPRLNYYTFYGENDCTIGQFIEKVVISTLSQMLDPKAICTGKNCDQPLSRHCKVYAHNETRLIVAVEPLEGQVEGSFLHPPPSDIPTTWSTCRVCDSATPFIPVSEEMQRYSFSKFLELHFYPADVKLVQGAGCEHNIYQHHIRYFAIRGMAVRFQTDPITMYEIIYPPFRIRIRPETQLELKNADFQNIHRRNLYWYSGLVDDLRLISIDAAIGDEKHDAALLAEINTLIARAESERDEIASLANKVYKESAPTDTLALNKVHSYRQEKIVAWQQDFDRLPKPRPPSSTEKAYKRGSAFHSVRSIWPKRHEISGLFDNQYAASTVSEAEEGSMETKPILKEKHSFSTISTTMDDTSPQPSSRTGQSSSDAGFNAGASELSTQAATEEEVGNSETDSDSTIGASREIAPPMIQDDIQVGVIEPFFSPPYGNFQETPNVPIEEMPRASRLPRRTTNQPTVAQLVRKYQDFLPAQGVQDLAKTALPPRFIMSESEQEYASPVLPVQRRTVSRNKPRPHVPRKGSISDFEQSYTANVAPIYLTRSRRAPITASGSRIPAPVASTSESHNSSRRTSPEKRPSTIKSRDLKVSRPSSPLGNQAAMSSARPSNNRIPSQTKDKTASRVIATANNKSGFRRPPAGGVRVSTITKHFERMNKDAERLRNRYNVIRGKRARPVTSARARVEILESVRDAIKDETDDSDVSSEADDEADGNEEDVRKPPRKSDTAEELQGVPVVSSTDAGIAIVENPGNKLLPVRNEGSSTELERRPPPPPISLPPSPLLNASKPKHDTLTPPTFELETIPIGPERGSLLKALSGFWSQQTLSSKQPIDMDDPMLNDLEYIFNDPSMILRRDEPTSIIALALDSPQYRDMMAKSRAEKRTTREAKLTEGGEAFMPDDRSVAESTSTWGVVNLEGSDLADPTEELKMASSKSPWVISTLAVHPVDLIDPDNEAIDSGSLTISCTVLYPEQFDALRRAYDCERSMIESLSRCVKWNASGGKSGSAFLKTKDDRFIAKELSRPELQTMETFAPSYFEYMSSAVSAHRPTLLAKVFGCYKLTFKKNSKDKNSGKSNSFQMNLLVMENLFYDRRFTKIYDLKGSTRNRHVQSTGRENEVLLDENLVESAHLHPFYLREHSKRILRGALYNDSKFLADINVMDYSLVVGVDSQKNELVIGIVDYQRTYTWDKKLESWVKESAFLGGGRGEPTIVTPKQYRQRFLSAMERYLPLIPDRWMKQKDTPEEDSNCLTELWPDW